MKLYLMLLLFLFFGCFTCSKCNDFFQNEQGCISSVGISCKWNSQLNQCMESAGLYLGCLPDLNLQACISQISYPDKSIAECVFSGYCRDAFLLGDSCDNNLSRSGCLAVTNAYCLWKDKCITLQEDQVQELLEQNDLTEDLKFSSVKVCQSITQFPVIHQRGAHQYLKTRYLNSIVNQEDTDSYNDLLGIPGCLEMVPEILNNIDCDADGLNILSCLQLKNKYCIFRDGKCQTISDFNNLRCSDQISQETCLSILTPSETCQWENSKCTSYSPTSKSICQSGIQVSPSVCAMIESEECFYDEQTKMCSKKCRAQQYQNSENKSLCQESSYGCSFNETSLQCEFKSNQCDKLGQNLQACYNVNQYCSFLNGFCKSIENLNLMRCQSGLNRLACINLTTPSQICQFKDKKCLEIDVSFEDQCEFLIDVNQNACKKVTTVGCYWHNGNCLQATGSQVCQTLGFNKVFFSYDQKIACLSTKNSISPCFWNGSTGNCEPLKINANNTCESLKMVNAVACKYTSDVFCKYNSVLYQCEKFEMTSSIKCITEGLNAVACTAIIDTSQSCRWQQNTCQQIAQLESTVQCQTLEQVTQKTCALVQFTSQRCVYAPATSSCQTSVTPSLGCNVAGLNPTGCAFQQNACFFDTLNKQCKDTTDLDLNKISCQNDYASKSSCLSIKTRGQYCQWITKKNQCVQYQFPAINQCDTFKLVNKQFCLAYQVTLNQDWSSKRFCTYNSSENKCEVPTFEVTGCGTDSDINLHACAGLSDITKTCYFNTETLKCYEIIDPLQFSTLKCVYSNKKTCTLITTIDQNCWWQDWQFKCSPNDNIQDCGHYTNDAYRQSNKNLCARTRNDAACQYDEVNSYCKIVDNKVTDLACANNGLNKNACQYHTSGSCIYDPDIELCLEVTTAIIQKLRCSNVNKGGCLASLFENCFWSSDTNQCLQVTFDQFDSIQCDEVTNRLYNPIILGQITSTGEICEYDPQAYLCRSFDNGTVLYNCLAGYDEKTCYSNINCKQWVYNATTNSYQSYLCLNLAENSACSLWQTETDCLDVTNDLCGWKQNACIQVNSSLSCNQLTAAVGKFTIQVCQQLNKLNDYCQYDEINQACLPVTADDNSCDVQGLNKYACIAKTKGSFCQFLNDFTQEPNGCQTISDFSNCDSSYNMDSCVNISSLLCYFDLKNNICNQIDKLILYQNNKCSDFNDPTKVIVTQSICKFLGGSDGCFYDSINQVCKVTTSLLPLCSSDPSINTSFCQNQIQNEICYFDWDKQECLVFDTTTADCSQCLSFKQCVNSQLSPCQWNGSLCVAPIEGSSCTSLTHVNSLTCMQFINNNDKCQFKNSGTSTSCIVPINDNQPCDGLNQAACIANLSNSCYYYNNKCVDITNLPFLASCATCFNQNDCVRIKIQNQFCQWVDGQCEAISVNPTDTCAQYASPTYSVLVCASITTGNCIWNNGCVVGTAANCETLGANQNACINATTGNCVFSQGVCQEATNASSHITIQCTDPSNKGGCLNISNGLTCKWTGTQCDYQTVEDGCATYSDVNSQVCAKTTGTPCQWVNNACQVVAVKGDCTDTGLNQLACQGFTDNFCYFDSSLNQCKSIDSGDDLKKMNCNDNLNESACLNHPNQCCYWDSLNYICSGISPGSDCSALASTSNYCCQHVVGDSCTLPYCSKMVESTTDCSKALNQNACRIVNNPCRWIQQDFQCISISNTFGCKSGLNIYACVHQTSYCKYVNGQCTTATLTDYCGDLQISSLSQTKCTLTVRDRCSTGDQGCITPSIDADCNSNLNYFACIDNIQYCQWNKTLKQCSQITSVIPPSTCPTGLISRGYCSFALVQCKLDMSTFICSPLQDSDSCDQKTSVATKNSSVCLSVQTEICQYDQSAQKCTSAIFGDVCTTVVTFSGCKLIENFCNWTDDSCQYNDPNQIFYTCESIFTKQQCLKNVNTACFWNPDQLICESFELPTKTTCSKLTDPLISPGVCFYFSTDYCAYNETGCYLEQQQTQCENSKSPLGCQANLSANCYWDIINGQCITLVDANQSSQMTCFQLKYSNKNFCIAPITEGQACQWKDNLCQNVNSDQTVCIDDLSLYGCQAVAKEGQFCIFDSICKNVNDSSISCTDNINIHACLAIKKDGQYCKWLGQKCSSLAAEDGYLLDTHILINSNSCRKTYTKGGLPDNSLPPIGVKYNAINYVCQESDKSSDTCDTPGLNYYGCLMTQADTCDWNGIKCVKFANDQTYIRCDQYVTVSAKVCASITINGLKCQHNETTFNCENFKETTDMFLLDEQSGTYKNTIIGMNREACISVIRFPTIWKDGQCLYNIVKPTIDSCSSLQDVNQMSCAAVDKDDEICKYDKDGKCTSIFDGQIDTCETKGLNIVGCLLVENYNCRFVNGSCQTYTVSNTDLCSALKNSNAKVCKNVQSSSCKFSFVSRGCIGVNQYDQCSSQGINQLGCQSIPSCDWINSDCFCQGIIQLYQLNQCLNYNQNTCLDNDQCIVDGQECRNKQCSDLSKEQCNGQLGIYNCYFNQSKCSSASKCSELKNISNCTDYILNGKQCDKDLYNANHCVDQSCEHFTENNCIGNCIWNSSSCTQIECINMKKDQCSGIMNNKQCFWNGRSCLGLTECQDYITKTTETDSLKLQTLCNSNKINNKQCKWVKVKPFDQNYSCTSSICQSQGTSLTNCHGVEVQSDVCILLSDYSCIACSEITDLCTCMTMNGYCYYNETKGCSSYLCSNFDQDLCVQHSQRCIYSNNQCKPICEKLKQEKCIERQLQDECQWDNVVEKCLDGPVAIQNINTISNVIIITNLKGILLALAILIMQW